jgi:hypothetical protein
MKKIKNAFPGILVVGLLITGSIGLLLFSQGNSVGNVEMVKYNAWNSLK